MSTSPDKNSAKSLLDIPKGDLIAYAVPALYLSTAPVAAFIATTGVFSRAVPAVLRTFGVQSGKSIAALGGIYFLFAYPISGGWSIYGQTLGPASQYSNREPRSSQRLLTGLGRRLVSTHHNLLETFPAWAFAAALVQVLAPRDEYLTNLLALHVLLKSVVFPVAYIADFDLVRSVSHMMSIGSLAAVFWRVARSA